MNEGFQIGKVNQILLVTIFLFLVANMTALAQNDADSSRQDFSPSLSAYPYAYYTPETSVAIGAGGVLTFFTGREPTLNPSKITLSGFYSTIKAYEIFLVSELFFSENKFASKIDLNFSHNVDKFFGIGNATPERGNESFLLDNYGGILDFQMPPLIAMADRGGVIYEYRYYSVVDRQDNPYLDDPSLVGKDGGVVSGIGLKMIWDTRDNVFFPNRGGLTLARAIFYTKDIGSDFTYSLLEYDTRRYWAFAKDKVLAVQAYILTLGGNPPFFSLPALGGSHIMRGYYEGRYRDYNYLAFQIEYRQYFWKRFGFVAFAGFGDVTGEITNFNLRNLKETYGVGLRYLFDEKAKINLRMDIGFGVGTSGVYFGMEEAF